MISPKSRDWKVASTVDPFDVAAIRCQNAIEAFEQIADMTRDDIERYKKLEKEAYNEGLSKVVDIGYLIHELYGKMLDAQDMKHDIETAWRKWDIDELLRLGVIDRDLAKAMKEAPVEP